MIYQFVLRFDGKLLLEIYVLRYNHSLFLLGCVIWSVKLSHSWVPIIEATNVFYFLHRYNRRRTRSRSISHSPDSYRGRYRYRKESRSPIRSPSPRDKRPSISEGLKSRLGPKIEEGRSPVKKRFRSSPRSSSHSKSPETSSAKNRNRISSASPSKSASSSPSGQRGLVSYAD